MSNTKKISRVDALAEVRRRKAPKGSKERNAYPRREVMELGGDELKLLAGITGKAQAVAAAPAPQKVSRVTRERTPEEQAATKARSQAWAALMAERAAAKAENRKPAFKYADACAQFGTTPARKS